MRRRSILAALTVAALGVIAAVPALAATPQPASGEFDAIVDFATLTATPVGNNCLLQVEGKLVFSGTLDGEAVGVTTARVFAPCDDVLASPPGTFSDVFKSELAFDGTVDGVPVQASVVYQGRAQEGGAIEAQIRLSGGAQGVLRSEAQLAVGGSYDGFINVR